MDTTMISGVIKKIGEIQTTLQKMEGYILVWKLFDNPDYFIDFDNFTMVPFGKEIVRA